jgi:hypothetical protein
MLDFRARRLMFFSRKRFADKAAISQYDEEQFHSPRISMGL